MADSRHKTMPSKVDDLSHLEHGVKKVECDECGHPTEIMTPAPSTDHPETGEPVEITWKCDCKNHRRKPVEKYPDDCECEHTNVIAGHAGEPGEGQLNPFASALNDAEILEAAERRGLIRVLDTGGAMVTDGGSKVERSEIRRIPATPVTSKEDS